MAEKKNKLDNLIPAKPGEDAREKGRKGGIKSGKVRRVNKSLKDFAKQMLNTNIVDNDMDPELKARLREMGVDADELCGKAIMLYGIYKKACAGDSQAYDRVCRAICEDEAAGDESFKINVSVGGVSVNENKI